MIVSIVNSEQFTIIKLLISPFPDKKNTKSLFSVFEKGVKRRKERRGGRSEEERGATRREER